MNNVKFRESLSNELISIKDRVRHLIGNKHWGEEGRYKENILMNFIRNQVPGGVSVGTGFVVCGNNKITSQIDILIYDNKHPVVFKNGDFVIVTKESVLGIIEVKTKIKKCEFENIFKKAHENGRLINRNIEIRGESVPIFNGIFSYEIGFKFNNDYGDKIKRSLQTYGRYINNISFGKDYFLKYWDDYYDSVPRCNESSKWYRTYKLSNLSFGYFLGNLIEGLTIATLRNPISSTIAENLFPIKKEDHRYLEYDVPIFENL